MYQFPKDLYADIRIEESYGLGVGMRNGELDGDRMLSETGARIRVFDGKMWYTSVTNNLEEIQQELDNLATLATPNTSILDHPLVKSYEVHQDTIIRFEDEMDVRKISRAECMELLEHYIEACIDDSVSEIQQWHVIVACNHTKTYFYSSKGAKIVQDKQNCWLDVGYSITVDGITTGGSKAFCKVSMDELWGHEKEILSERARYLDYAHNAVDVEPGEYTCVFSPSSTALFAHESFGHKSEADYMLNDKTLQDEWVIGKRVGSELVSICDRGDWLNYGYTPYDDEGTRARETWLMKDGVLTGRLHDVQSSVALGEPLTGNARACNYNSSPIVRMTNTFMKAGKDNPQRMIEEVKDGIYIYSVDYGTGQAAFTIKPSLAYRIREGRLAEPLRIHVMTGSVFQTLFDIDAVGTDFEMFDTFTCGKMGQTIKVSAGGPSIRVKKMTVN